MHPVHPADTGRRSAASPSRISKFLAAGVALAGAGAIAVSPVSPVSPITDDITAENRAVTLNAYARPIDLVQQFVAETSTNLQLLRINSQNSSDALAAAVETADPLGELADIIALNATNPLPLVTRLLSFQAVYGDDIDVVLNGWDDNPATPNVVDPYQGVFERWADAMAELGPTIADMLTYDPPATDPTQGPFTNAVYEANFYFVLGLLDTLRPLVGATPTGIVPLFSIPGDFLGGEPAGGFEGALPGVVQLDNVVNVINEQTFVRALTGPFQTAAFQVAKSLDDALAAQQAGDTALAVNELINIPIRATNAFVNGFAPSFSPNGAEWPSLIDATQQQSGLIKYVMVDFKNQLTTALGGTTPAPVTTLPSTTVPSTTLPSTTGTNVQNRVNPLAVTAPAEDSSAPEVSPAPEVSKVDDDATTLVNNTTSGDSDTTTGDADSKPVKKKATAGTFAKKTQEALKKAGEDVNKAVSNVFKPKKKDSTKAEPTKASDSGAGDSAGDSKGGDTGGDSGGDS